MTEILHYPVHPKCTCTAMHAKYAFTCAECAAMHRQDSFEAQRRANEAQRELKL